MRIVSSFLPISLSCFLTIVGRAYLHYSVEKVPERKNVMLTRVVVTVIKKLKQVMKIVMQKGPQVSFFLHTFFFSCHDLSCITRAQVWGDHIVQRCSVEIDRRNTCYACPSMAPVIC